MNAEEFNNIFEAKATEYLVPLGFKKMGTSYYIIEGENVLSLKKGSFRGAFTGFLLCYGHTFLNEFKDGKGKIKIPGYPENYPLTIDSLDLDNLSAKYDCIADFDYEFSFSKRQMKFLYISGQDEILNLSSAGNEDYREVPVIDEKFIENALLQTRELGIKYFRQLTPEITLSILKKLEGLNDWKEEIKRHQITDNKPSKKSGRKSVN